MLKRVRAAALAALIWAAPLASSLAGGIPELPPTPPFNDPSQVIATLNAIISQLNGQGIGTGGYAPPAIAGLGNFCTVSNVVPATPVTCNGQRGIIFTGTLTTAALASQTFLINNSFITGSTNACFLQQLNFSGTFSTAGIPFLWLAFPTAGQLQVFFGNLSAANALNGTMVFAFNCVN